MKKALLMYAVLACFGAASLGAQVIGTIDYLEGGVEITRYGARLSSPDIGTRIENLDVIKTGPDGMVSIVFDRSTNITGTVKVVPSSTATLRTEQLSGRPANQVEVMAGSVNLKVKRLAGMDAGIQVRTPSAVLGVRGTEFVVMSFNGTALVACNEGEVFCSSSSTNRNGVSSVPGVMVQVFETGALDSGRFPEGDFYENWAQVSERWKGLKVEIFVEEPMPLLNQLVQAWDVNAPKIAVSLNKLKANQTIQTWLRDTSTGTPAGGMAQWVVERPKVMQDLISVRPDLVMAMTTYFRLSELIPHVPDSAMNQRLSNGKTFAAFLREFKRSESAMMEAMSIFHAAEKQYMRRNDGISPFTDF